MPSEGVSAPTARTAVHVCTDATSASLMISRALDGPSGSRWKFGDSSASIDTASGEPFAEQIDPFALRQQRRTAGLSDALRSLGYALGGAAAARLASRLGMTTSGDTVLRELRRAGSTVPATPPVVVGIDDWAITPGAPLPRDRGRPGTAAPHRATGRTRGDGCRGLVATLPNHQARLAGSGRRVFRSR